MEPAVSKARPQSSACLEANRERAGPAAFKLEKRGPLQQVVTVKFRLSSKWSNREGKKCGGLTTTIPIPMLHSRTTASTVPQLPRALVCLRRRRDCNHQGAGGLPAARADRLTLMCGFPNPMDPTIDMRHAVARRLQEHQTANTLAIICTSPPERSSSAARSFHLATTAEISSTMACAAATSRR